MQPTGMIDVDRYVCSLCGKSYLTEDDVFYHIEEEHSTDEIIEMCIEKHTVQVPAEELQMTL